MEQPRLARRQRYSFIRRFRAKSSDMWSTRSLNFFNNDRQLAFACGTSPLRMFRYSKGRYRSGQTGQTVNLLALRLRWFESSPAHFSVPSQWRRRRAPRDFARGDVDLRRAFAVPRRRAEVFRARLVERFFVFARVVFFPRDLAEVLRGRFFAGGRVRRLNAFCAAGAIGSPAAACLPAIAPTAPPTAAPTGPD